MSQYLWYALLGAGLILIGVIGIITHKHLIRIVLAFNILGSGVFMIYVALAKRSAHADPVPHAMVLTGLVVAVSGTALALNLIERIHKKHQKVELPEERQ